MTKKSKFMYFQPVPSIEERERRISILSKHRERYNFHVDLAPPSDIEIFIKQLYRKDAEEDFDQKDQKQKNEKTIRQQFEELTDIELISIQEEAKEATKLWNRRNYIPKQNSPLTKALAAKVMYSELIKWF